MATVDTEHSLWWGALIAIVFVIGGAAGFLAASVSEPGGPFYNAGLACHQDEVGVWDRYPETYNCVPADDHASHQGG